VTSAQRTLYEHRTCGRTPGPHLELGRVVEAGLARVALVRRLALDVGALAVQLLAHHVLNVFQHLHRLDTYTWGRAAGGGR